MGVNSLWQVLEDAKEVEPLAKLRGLKVAIDMSGWICENKESKGAQSADNLHIRNIFFRTARLIQLGILPIFVLDGGVIELKEKTVRARNRQRYNCVGVRKKSKRSRFDRVIRQCTKMLTHLGVPFIQAKGEAEALCGVLNNQGIVDGCITNDNDCLLYGAKTVYRHFSIDKKGEVETYRMSDIESKLGLNREKLIAMALLLGCDYDPKGVVGVGKENAYKFIRSAGTDDILERFRKWKKRDIPIEPLLPKTSHCTVCNHVGKHDEHTRLGCPTCGGTCTQLMKTQACPCDWHVQTAKNKLESFIRTKIGLDPNFPNEDIINEFLDPDEEFDADENDITAKRPVLKELQDYFLDYLDWTADYAANKIIPLISSFEAYRLIDNSRFAPSLQLKQICKVQIRNGDQFFEVEWEKLAEDQSHLACYFSFEDQDLMNKAYPEAVAKYLEGKNTKKPKKASKPPKAPKPSKPPKPKTGSQKSKASGSGAETNSSQESLESQIHHLSIDELSSTETISSSCSSPKAATQFSLPSSDHPALLQEAYALSPISSSAPTIEIPDFDCLLSPPSPSPPSCSYSQPNMPVCKAFPSAVPFSLDRLLVESEEEGIDHLPDIDDELAAIARPQPKAIVERVREEPKLQLKLKTKTKRNQKEKQQIVLCISSDESESESKPPEVSLESLLLRAKDRLKKNKPQPEPSEVICLDDADDSGYAHSSESSLKHTPSSQDDSIPLGIRSDPIVQQSNTFTPSNFDLQFDGESSPIHRLQQEENQPQKHYLSPLPLRERLMKKLKALPSDIILLD